MNTVKADVWMVRRIEWSVYKLPKPLAQALEVLMTRAS